MLGPIPNLYLDKVPCAKGRIGACRSYTGLADSMLLAYRQGSVAQRQPANTRSGMRAQEMVCGVTHDFSMFGWERYPYAVPPLIFLQ